MDIQDSLGIVLVVGKVATEFRPWMAGFSTVRGSHSRTRSASGNEDAEGKLSGNTKKRKIRGPMMPASQKSPY
jgi:hypothetical protein